MKSPLKPKPGLNGPPACYPECGAIFRDERSPSRGSMHFGSSMREYIFYVYILQSASRRALYIGMTNNLRRRVFQHKTHQFEGFTDDYNAIRLVYWEKFGSVGKAIAREKQLKRWRREKKIWLVESVNPKWRDLALEWYPQVDVAKDGLATASSTTRSLGYAARPLRRTIGSARDDSSVGLLKRSWQEWVWPNSVTYEHPTQAKTGLEWATRRHTV